MIDPWQSLDFLPLALQIKLHENSENAEIIEILSPDLIKCFEIDPQIGLKVLQASFKAFNPENTDLNSVLEMLLKLQKIENSEFMNKMVFRYNLELFLRNPTENRALTLCRNLENLKDSSPEESEYLISVGWNIATCVKDHALRFRLLDLISEMTTEKNQFFYNCRY